MKNIEPKDTKNLAPPSLPALWRPDAIDRQRTPSSRGPNRSSHLQLHVLRRIPRVAQSNIGHERGETVFIDAHSRAAEATRRRWRGVMLPRIIRLSLCTLKGQRLAHQ